MSSRSFHLEQNEIIQVLTAWGKLLPYTLLREPDARDLVIPAEYFKNPENLKNLFILAVHSNIQTFKHSNLKSYY